MMFKSQIEQTKVRAEMVRLGNQMDVLKRSGLDKEAKRLLPKYNSLVMQVKELGEQIETDRRRSAQALLVCFVVADLATLAAEQFGKVCDEVNQGSSPNDNEFVKMMKYHAEVSAERWNKVVQVFDEGVQRDNVSMFYSEFSEQITDKILPMLNDSVKAVMDTEKGKKWL
jgi:hypothetical protein